MNCLHIEYYIPNLKLKNINGTLSLSDDYEIKNGLTAKELKNKISNSSNIKEKLKIVGENLNFEKNGDDFVVGFDFISDFGVPRSNLFLEFSDISSDDEVYNFISKNGFLGLHIDTIERLPVFMRPVMNYFVSGYCETVDEIRTEAKKIKNIIKTFGILTDAIKDGETSIEFENIEEAMTEAENNINVVIKNISLKTQWGGSDKEPWRLYTEWLPKTLLEFMYTELVKRYSSRLFPRICPNCGRSFEPMREGTIYCQHDNGSGRSCQEIAKQRRFIENRKKKHTQKGSPE